MSDMQKVITDLQRGMRTLPPSHRDLAAASNSPLTSCSPSWVATLISSSLRRTDTTRRSTSNVPGNIPGNVPTTHVTASPQRGYLYKAAGQGTSPNAPKVIGTKS